MRPVFATLMLLPVSAAMAAPPAPAASVGAGETSLSVQNEVVRELKQTVRLAQTRVDQMNRQLDELTNETDPGAPSLADAPGSPLSGADMIDRLSALSQQIEASDERLSQLRAQAANPDGTRADLYAAQIAEAEQANAADRNDLAALGTALNAQQAQLQGDLPILQQMIAQNVDSVELEALQAKVAQEQANFAQLKSNYQEREAAAMTAAAERRGQLSTEERGQDFAAQQDLERQTSEELARRQTLQKEYATFQKVYASRETSLEDAQERLRRERLKLDRVTEELGRQQALLAQIAHS